MQAEPFVQGLQVSAFPDDRLTIRGILLHNHNWDRYAFTRREELRPVEVAEADKLLSCHGPERGSATYVCRGCGTSHVVTFGCNSRLCSRCGKPHADKWAASLRKTILPLPHRHLTFTIPQELWPVVRRHREALMKAMMDATSQTLEKALSEMIHGPRRVRVGAIVVLHPFGRDLSFKPHVHVICTEGAFERDTFVPRTFFPMRLFRKTWTYHVLSAFRRVLKKNGDQEGAALIDETFCKYPEGFYVHLTKETRVSNPDKILRYVGRYVRHPAIAESRLVGYDGKHVTFKWNDHTSGGEKHRTLLVDEFISAILQHVPDRHFKMVRHYGVYSRSLKAHYRRLAGLWSLTQTAVKQFSPSEKPRRVVKCPSCGQDMDLVLYDRPPTAPEAGFGSKINDWHYLPPSPTSTGPS